MTTKQHLPLLNPSFTLTPLAFNPSKLLTFIRATAIAEAIAILKQVFRFWPALIQYLAAYYKTLILKQINIPPYVARHPIYQDKLIKLDEF
jgi:hypothetical protein